MRRRWSLLALRCNWWVDDDGGGHWPGNYDDGGDGGDDGGSGHWPGNDDN